VVPGGARNPAPIAIEDSGKTAALGHLAIQKQLPLVGLKDRSQRPTRPCCRRDRNRDRREIVRAHPLPHELECVTSKGWLESRLLQLARIHHGERTIVAPRD